MIGLSLGLAFSWQGSRMDVSVNGIEPFLPTCSVECCQARHAANSSCPTNADAQILSSIEQRARAQYGKTYWSWQSQGVDIGGKITALLFEPHIKTHYVILDYGCGSGTLIMNLPARERWCVEANPLAREFSAQKFPDLKIQEFIDNVPDNMFDVIMSNHALEHVPCPLVSLSKIKAKLKVGGRAVFYVPSMEDQLSEAGLGGVFNPSDIHHHLHVWGPQQLGNLFIVAGFEIVEARTKKYSRSHDSDAAWSKGGATEFWKVAEQENRHPQTMVIAERRA